MKITPLEIRQKIFEKTLRGYDKEEVSAFLITLSRAWEQMQDELKQMHARLGSREREIAKLREMESTLHKTLKAAERASTNAVEQANKQAELQLKGARLQANDMLKNAKMNAETTISNSKNTAEQILTEMNYELKKMTQHYKEVVNAKEGLERALSHTIDEVQEKIKNLQNQMNDFDPDQYLTHITAQLHRTTAPDTNRPLTSDESISNGERERREDEAETSFFDQL